MVSLGGENTDKYVYVVQFTSAKDDTKKAAIIAKIKETLKPYLTDGTIQATTDAIRINVVSEGESYSINSS